MRRVLIAYLPKEMILKQFSLYIKFKFEIVKKDFHLYIFTLRLKLCICICMNIYFDRCLYIYIWEKITPILMEIVTWVAGLLIHLSQSFKQN